MCNVKYLKTGLRRIGYFAFGLLLSGLMLPFIGCTQGLDSSGKWRTFGSPEPTPPVTKPSTDSSPQNRELAKSGRVASRQNQDPRAQAAEKRVHEEVEQLMQAMEQSRKNQKQASSPQPAPSVGDSDSLATKMAQPSPTPTPTVAPTPNPETPKPVITRPVIKPVVEVRPEEGKMVLPANRRPYMNKKSPAEETKLVVGPSPVLTPVEKPQQQPAGKAIKITTVEPVLVSKPKEDATIVKTEKIPDPMLEPVGGKDDLQTPTPSVTPSITAPNVTSGVAPAPVSVATSANTAVKIDVPDPDNPNAALDMLLFRLEDKLKDRPEDTATQVKLRLIYAVLGQWQQAMKDKGTKDSTGSEMARNVAALVKAFDNPDMSSAQQANEGLRIIEQMQGLLRRQADLVVKNLELCREVSSFGCFKLMPNEYFVAGKQLPVIVYLELDNFTSKYVSDRKVYQTLLSMTIEVLDESGRSVWRQRYDQIEDTANHQRKDFYLAPQITLPAGLSAGKVKLKITVEDLHGNKVAQRPMDLVLHSR